MDQTLLRSRTLVILVLTMLLTTFVVAVPATRASADNPGTLFPPGCNRIVRQPWAGTCWVGHNFVNHAVTVLGVQFILSATGHNPGVPDCWFGSRSDNATVAYQRARGLDRDGVVGGATWGAMQGELFYSGIQDLYGYYYNVGPDGLRFYYDVILANITGTKAAWHVLDPYAQPPGYVTMNAPHSFFCP